MVDIGPAHIDVHAGGDGSEVLWGSAQAAVQVFWVWQRGLLPYRVRDKPGRGRNRRQTGVRRSIKRDIIHLLPSLEGDMKICSTQKIHVTRGRSPRDTYRISNEFSFHTMYYETSCVFYIPEPLARGYNTHNEFHNTSYGMKIHLRFFLSHELTRNEQITRWNRLFPRIGDGWRRCLLRVDNNFAWYSVISMRRRSHFNHCWNQKQKEEHVLV